MKIIKYILYCIIPFFIAIDQFIKFLVVKYLQPVETYPILQNILHLTYLENRGAAFGSFEGNKFILIFVSGIILLISFFLMFTKKIQNIFYKICFGFVIAGGIGNLIDRIFRGYVVDYIDFRIINFAVFNFADILISLSSISLIIYIVFFEKHV